MALRTMQLILCLCSSPLLAMEKVNEQPAKSAINDYELFKKVMFIVESTQSALREAKIEKHPSLDNFKLQKELELPEPSPEIGATKQGLMLASLSPCLLTPWGWIPLVPGHYGDGVSGDSWNFANNHLTESLTIKEIQTRVLTKRAILQIDNYQLPNPLEQEELSEIEKNNLRTLWKSHCTKYLEETTKK